MKEIETILTENKDKVYLWGDKETIDVVVDNENKSFIEELLNFKCLKCDANIVNGNEHLINNFTESVSGIKIKCANCQLKMFIHKPIKNI
jgi:hypothetical protein